MSNDKVDYLLIDTSYLRKAGFQHPDLRKLLLLSKEGALKIFIPHIVWEERRTQLLEDAFSHVRDLRKAFDKVTGRLVRDVVLDGLAPPTLIIWTDAEIDANSKKAMTAFAAENMLEIVSIATDHAERAWERYFNVAPPFNPLQPRENRRKDIPDSWILETAIDLATKHPSLIALCDDDNLATALKNIDIRVFKDAQQVLDEINRSATSKPEIKAAGDHEARPENDGRLEAKIREALQPFEGLDTKVLGYVGYLGSPTKDQLFSLLSQSGISIEIAKNVAERLTISGVITDTGNHYLAVNKDTADLAASSVEAEIIKLLES